MSFLLHKKKILFLIAACIALLYGKSWILYFTDHQAPSIEYSEIEENGIYTNKISFNIIADDAYGIKTCTLYCDEKECTKISCKNQQHAIIPVTVDQNFLSDGKHTLSIEVTDGSWNKNNTKKTIHIAVDTVPLEAVLLTKEADIFVEQGNTLHLFIQTNKKHAFGTAIIDALSVPIVPIKEGSNIYECFIPCSTETKPGKYIVTCELEDKLKNKTTLEIIYHVKEKIFEKQSIKLTGDNRSAFETSHILNQDPLNEALELASSLSPTKKLWKGERFYSPCLFKRISTQFGVLRNSAERGKYRHNGVDLVAKPLSPVWACQDGVVVVKDKFLYTGNTVVIDHGCGILSLYGHLDSFDSECEVGKSIKRGNIIGTIGMTGYATSYHLHWEIIIANIKVNPLEWIDCKI